MIKLQFFYHFPGLTLWCINMGNLQKLDAPEAQW